MLIPWNVTIPRLSGDTPRRAFVWLPESYDEEPEKRYPVLYMFDGHNVFRDEYAAFGKSWGMETYLEETGKELIVVAVECNHEGKNRLMEYSPVTYRNREHGTVPGKAPIYMKWLTEQLKPYVDQHLRTLPDRDHTSLAGSSMGGLIALYGVSAYNSVFRQAACLSPSLWVSPGKLLSMVSRAKYSPDTVIYMDYGQLEMDNHSANRRAIFSVANALLTKGVNLSLRIVPNGNHSEASWEKQVPIFMECLGL